ncbi:hypothetical protein [Prevotella sp. HUN102]|uniref:hypothetical protein n=1 Tax=Prevotella sp. HUN102 TaxID=1392486 RepID=UPI00048C0167|nr:hypothetical protein [Prevotella sp. HUN102]
MGNLLESLKKYFENTPKEILDSDWKDREYLNEIGPDVFEYANFVRKSFGIEVSYSILEKKSEAHKFDVSAAITNNEIAADALYCLAA